MQKFIDYLYEQGRSPMTVKGYRTDIKMFARWFIKTNGETLSPSVVTPTDIREFRQYMLTVQRYKASTINRRLAAISVYMNWAKQIGLVDHNPVENIKSIAQVDAGPKYLDKKEQYALQRAIEKDLQLSKVRYPKRWRTRQRDASIVIFLLNSGLRLSELVSLTLNDVDISERSGRVEVIGKGNKQRTVPLNSHARTSIQEWLAVRPEINSIDYLWMPMEYRSDKPISGRSVQRILKRFGQEANLEHLTPHVLRHTFAKNLVDRGVGLEKIAALLGHSSLNTTRIYVKPNQKDLEDAVDELVDE
jgi:site-specific recombinase XerD